ncbi:hypothetical protein FRACYDRAFT_237150 [Fragilariopsis cylindrus CCMP1102]|uniref:TLC domain-containing protein n=1 Tax=Fragilariopsis cylindrus CCMP1102 TaxID=635003 RepID=A0A1E7FL60_9STRA|nr:hypothetical protein FRACYDRAFT_237150 [Fragilariopsis cylindrus CCMP1102]|eukprot:OEU18867.1 hypothetical protein FRACYDRAFT_237150 [Fragilariopsis cylindrus CCMP1102]
MTEVGVSLALRRHRSLIGSKKDFGKTKTTTTNNNNIKLDKEKRKRRLRSPSPRFSQQDVVGDGIIDNNDKKKQKSKKRNDIILDGGGPSYSCWRILFEGAALYIFCMVLPNLFGIIVRLYQTFLQKGGIIFYQIIGYICSKSWLVESQRCRMYLLNLNNDDDISSMKSSGLALDAGISDVAIVILLSLSMAITRVTLVHFLVPNYRQPKRLEALVQCKSIHLLEFAYSGSVTPTKITRMKSFANDSAFVDGIQMPNLNGNERKCVDDYGNYEDEDDVQIAHSNEDGNDDADVNNIEIRPMFPSGSLMITNDEDHDEDQGNTTANDHETANDNDDAPSVSFGLLTRNSAQNLQALLEQASPSASAIVKQQKGEARRSSQNNSSKNEPTGDRIYAAPKYATAVFRLIYCLVSCLIGLRYFGSANFWPPALGGTGNTRNCWDLSSVGVTNIVDSDFDSSNTVLRRYYLIQASYHVHSAAFHLLTSILLWFVSKSSKNKQESSPRFLGFIPIGMFTLYNVQIFFQHIFLLVLIFGTFLFSSTRRLGAIAMVAFDASSLFLHLLQLGINAPHETSKQRRIGAWFYSSRKSVILILHRFLVIPSFCYARFYVFPFVVCYSALEESQDWLHQLENMLIPGTAKFIHGLFVIAFLLFLLLNLTYFWRLLNHPHVTYTLQQQQIKII